MKYSIDLVGHLTLDDKYFIENNQVQFRSLKELGGPPAYSSVIFPIMKANFRILSSVGEDFPLAYYEIISKATNSELFIDKSEKTTRFKHYIYPNFRSLYLMEKAKPLDEFVLEFEGSDACVCSPVFNEVGDQGFYWGKKEHNLLAIDIQGFLRDTDKENKIVYNYDRNKIMSYIENADVVKLSYDEAKLLTAVDSPLEMLNRLPSNNVEIITLGEKGLVYSNKGKKYSLLPPKVMEVDPTGAGDVFLSALVADFIQSDDLDSSIVNAVVLAALSVTTKGVKRTPTHLNLEELEEQVIKTIKQFG